MAPDKVDSEQFKKVQAFKKECNGWGLIETYRDHDDFREKLARHINRLVSMLLEGKPVPQSAPAAAPELTAESKTLLAEAVQDCDGYVLYVPTHDGADLPLTASPSSRRATHGSERRCWRR